MSDGYGEFAGMRCRPWRWLWGLLPLALLALAALAFSRSSIEADLQERTRFALEEAGLDWASSRFVGRDAAMTGQAFDEEDRTRALEVVRSTWGVRLATDEAALAAEISPYTWSATRVDNRVRIEGYAPGDEERRQIGSDAESILEGVSISNRLQIGRGAPRADRWEKAITFALEQLNRLEGGDASLSDLDLTIRGRARSVDAYKSIKSALASGLPRGVKLVLDEVQAPVVDPYQLDIALTAGGLTVSGHASSEETVKEIADAARGSFPKARPEIEIEVAGGAPERWVDAAGTVLSELAQLETGSVKIRNEVIEFTGETETEETADAVTQSVKKALPSNYQATVNITFRQAKVADIKPYTLNVTYADGALAIDGYAPDQDSLEDIAREAGRRFAGTTPRVGLTVGNGAPDGWRDAVLGVLGEVSRLEEGFAALRDTTIDITGVAEDEATADSVRTAIETRLPSGFQATASITAKAPEVAVVKPYTFDADHDGEKVILGGYVPSEEIRGALRRFAERTFPGARIEDRMNLGAGEPAGFQEAAEAGIEQLGRLDEGRMRMRDLDVEISGVAREQQIADSVVSEIKSSLPSRYRARPSIKVAEALLPEVNPFTWSADFDGRSVRLEGYVHSESARADVTAEGRRRLSSAGIDDRMQLGRTRIDEQIWLQRIDYALEQLGRLSPGRVALTGDGFTIRGTATDTAAYRAATTALKTMPPGLRLVSEDITPPAPEEFRWSLEVRDDRIVLEGVVPSEGARQDILDEVRNRFPGRRIDDRLELAGGLDGSESDWLTAARLGIRAVAMAGNGRAVLDSKRLTVDGTTDVSDLPEQVADLVGSSLPSGYDGSATIEYIGPSETDLAKQKQEEEARLAEEEKAKEEKARNYRWSATYDGLNVEFTGGVPGDRERLRIVNRTKTLLPGRSVEDRTKLEEGAPEGWLDAVLAGLDQLAGLESGRLEIVGLKITLRGTTDSEDTLARAKETMTSGLPRGYEGDNQVTYVAPPEPTDEQVEEQVKKVEKEDKVVKKVEQTIKSTTKRIAPEECEAVLNNRLRQGKLYFRRDSAKLDGRDQKTLEPLVKVMERCPDARIKIAGHTDSDGAAAYNQRLSEQRAQAVVDFLVSLGVDSQRLSAVGYGETKPVASNRRRAGKARNRRIEFEVSLR